MTLPPTIAGMYLGADSGQGGSNLTLIVAVLGIAGTLAAALMTQWMTTKRDERRLRWEQAKEADQWQREREERKEQWERENQVRLIQRRTDMYVDVLNLAIAAIAEIDACVSRSLEHERHGKMSAESIGRVKEGVERLLAIHNELDDTRASMYLLATDQAAKAVRSLSSAVAIAASAMERNADRPGSGAYTERWMRELIDDAWCRLIIHFQDDIGRLPEESPDRRRLTENMEYHEVKKQALRDDYSDTN